ncbi:phosphoribosylanthranilate isomerase [Nitratiruptor sp. YY09-18]|uniref:phosphoribosylanthranilate isomerase n=1 Tax=Nitratiruptor sp. YY09-18 TaxID=2724901 RepID=UPI00191678E1|nr:phosphoribosylanthranilate isomerase [Nitratiruptor sp. YY09-18]BCD67452.1 phosphoribosylanthranilate isomerase [Nitratiruptor sp. YY09-18]
MRVKICGITNIEDALVAIEAGADALGFVFYEKSPRFITPQKAKEIVSQLPPFVERVGLFVNEEPSQIDEICIKCNMSLAQIHFDVDEEFLARLHTKALPVVRAQEPQDILKFTNRYRLVDAYVPEFGGAGKRVALEWFAGVDCSKIILAGGLTPENVADVKPYGFYGVDVSSGVEVQKGKKDPVKVRQFIQKAKFE